MLISRYGMQMEFYGMQMESSVCNILVELRCFYKEIIEKSWKFDVFL